MSLSWDRMSAAREVKGWVDKRESKFTEDSGFFVVELTSPPLDKNGVKRMSGMTLVEEVEVEVNKDEMR